jgi:hypothetical protein
MGVKLLEATLPKHALSSQYNRQQQHGGRTNLWDASDIRATLYRISQWCFLLRVLFYLKLLEVPVFCAFRHRWVRPTAYFSKMYINLIQFIYTRSVVKCYHSLFEYYCNTEGLNVCKWKPYEIYNFWLLFLTYINYVIVKSCTFQIFLSLLLFLSFSC